MSRKLIGVTVLILALFVAAPPAQAVPIYEGAFLTILDLPDQGTTVGGAFLVAPARDSVFTPFISFCLQETESIVKNGVEVFQVVGITTWAEMEMAATGGDDVTKKDPVDAMTAWIYKKYLEGDWAALGLGAFSGDTPGESNLRGDAVQKAIWCLEGEDPTGTSGACNYGPAKLVMDAAGLAAPTGLGGITALNLIWTRNAYGHLAGDPAQDILNPIPEPASMLLFGSGLAGLAAMVRRRKR
jgi:hypothetical protein